MFLGNALKNTHLKLIWSTVESTLDTQLTMLVYTYFQQQNVMMVFILVDFLQI